MGRRTNIYFDDVTKAASAQLAGGTIPTNATIKAALGGSFTTIGPLLKRWKEEQALAAGPRVLPAEIASVLQAEIDKQIQLALLNLNERFSEANASVEELISENKTLETEITETAMRLANAQAVINTNEGAVAELRIQLGAEQRRAELTLDSLRRAEIALVRTESNQEIIDSLRSENATLRSQKKARGARLGNT